MTLRSTTGEAERYEIRIAGHLESRWADWFDGLSLTLSADGSTVIAGLVADQSALHGLLQKVRDLGLPLISVTRIDGDRPHFRPRNPPSPTEQET